MFMKKNILLLFLLFVYAHSMLGVNRRNQAKNTNIYIKKAEQIDKKPKFIPKRMTDAEQQRLTNFMKQKLYKAQQENNEHVIKAYTRLKAVLEQLISENLIIENIKDEKMYTEYFNLVITELESLGENPQLILQTTALRQKLLEGKLENRPWFVKEIGGLDWLFEQDAKQTALNTERAGNESQFMRNFSQTRWPKQQDKALYLMSLVDQIERNHQRIELTDLGTIIETCQKYLISFLPDMSNVFKRTIQEALNKLEKVRSMRGIPSLKK
jgi:hypothetical protein